MPRSVKPRRRPPISTEDRTIEHRVFGFGVIRYIKQVDDGTYAALVTFAGTERLVRIAPEYWLTPVDTIMRLIPLLPPPAVPKQKSKPTEMFGAVEPEDDEEEIAMHAEAEALQQ